MTGEKLIGILEYIPIVIGIIVLLLVIVGIIQRIYEHNKYGKDDEEGSATIEPLAHYGAMPVHLTKPTKLRFDLDEEQERLVEEAERKLKEMEKKQ